MIRRQFGLSLAFVLFGYFFTAHEYPQMQLIQIVFPLACGLASGIVLGRGLAFRRVAGHAEPTVIR